MQISKGLKAQEEILSQARTILNEEGFGITLADLAKRMGMTLGRITYHYPTKDLLFLSLARQYEEVLHQSRSSVIPEEYHFGSLVQRSSEAMDIQYDYRCVIRYIATSVRTQRQLFDHTSETFRKNRDRIREVIHLLVEAGSLEAGILHPETYEVILFQFTSLFTTWLINLEIYDTDASYAQMKPVYLNGIFACFLPFLTPKGREEWGMTNGKM